MPLVMALVPRIVLKTYTLLILWRHPIHQRKTALPRQEQSTGPAQVNKADQIICRKLS